MGRHQRDELKKKEKNERGRSLGLERPFLIFGESFETTHQRDDCADAREAELVELHASADAKRGADSEGHAYVKRGGRIFREAGGGCRRGRTGKAAHESKET